MSQLPALMRQLTAPSPPRLPGALPSDAAAFRPHNTRLTLRHSTLDAQRSEPITAEVGGSSPPRPTIILSAVVGDDQALMILMRGIVAGDAEVVAQSLATSPALASSSLRQGATRQSTQDFFFYEIAHYLFAGDTPLHAAAAAHRKAIVSELLSKGADVRARNRRGAQPLHYAADGMPGSGHLDPNAQRDTVIALLAAGADPNATDKWRHAPPPGRPQSVRVGGSSTY
jgi:ankyrin repeat protein